MSQLFASPLGGWAGILVAFVLIDASTEWSDRMTLTNGDEPHYLVTTYSIVHDRDFDVLNNYDPNQYRPWYRGTLDRHLLSIGGREHSLHGVGLPVLLAPGFALAGRDGAVATTMALMAFGIVQLYALCLAIVPRRAAVVTTAVCALSLPLVAYSRALYPDGIGFVVVTATMRVLWDMWDELRRGRLAAVLVALSLLPWLHPRFALFSAGFGLCALWVAWRTGKIRECAPLALIPIAGLCAYVVGIRALYDVSLGEFLNARSSGGSLFGLTHTGGLLGIFLDRTFGLLWYAPLYMFSFAGLVGLVRNRAWRRRFVPLGSVCLVYLLAIASFFEWHGGFAPPPRYLVPIMAPLVMGLAQSYETVLHMGRSWRFAVLLVPTLLIALLGSRYPLLLLPLETRNNFALGANALLPDFMNNQGPEAYGWALGWLALMALFVCWPERRPALGAQGKTRAG